MQATASALSFQTLTGMQFGSPVATLHFLATKSCRFRDNRYVPAAVSCTFFSTVAQGKSPTSDHHGHRHCIPIAHNLWILQDPHSHIIVWTATSKVWGTCFINGQYIHVHNCLTCWVGSIKVQLITHCSTFFCTTQPLSHESVIHFHNIYYTHHFSTYIPALNIHHTPSMNPPQKSHLILIVHF